MLQPPPAPSLLDAISTSPGITSYPGVTLRTTVPAMSSGASSTTSGQTSRSATPKKPRPAALPSSRDANPLYGVRERKTRADNNIARTIGQVFPLSMSAIDEKSVSPSPCVSTRTPIKLIARPPAYTPEFSEESSPRKYVPMLAPSPPTPQGLAGVRRRTPVVIGRPSVFTPEYSDESPHPKFVPMLAPTPPTPEGLAGVKRRATGPVKIPLAPVVRLPAHPSELPEESPSPDYDSVLAPTSSTSQGPAGEPSRTLLDDNGGEERVMPPLQAHKFAWTVLWDIENVPVPSEFNGAQVIRALIERLGRLRGVGGASSELLDPVRRIIVFLNVATQRVSLLNELQSNGASLHHVETRGRKDAADKALITELCMLALEVQPPAGIALLSGDQDFAYPLSTMRNRGFTTAVIAPNRSACSPLLMSVPDVVWSFRKDLLADVEPKNLPRPVRPKKGSAKKSPTAARNPCTPPHKTAQPSPNQQTPQSGEKRAQRQERNDQVEIEDDSRTVRAASSPVARALLFESADEAKTSTTIRRRKLPKWALRLTGWSAAVFLLLVSRMVSYRTVVHVLSSLLKVLIEEHLTRESLVPLLMINTTLLMINIFLAISNYRDVRICSAHLSSSEAVQNAPQPDRVENTQAVSPPTQLVSPPTQLVSSPTQLPVQAPHSSVVQKSMQNSPTPPRIRRRKMRPTTLRNPANL